MMGTRVLKKQRTLNEHEDHKATQREDEEGGSVQPGAASSDGHSVNYLARCDLYSLTATDIGRLCKKWMIRALFICKPPL